MARARVSTDVLGGLSLDQLDKLLGGVSGEGGLQPSVDLLRGEGTPLPRRIPIAGLPVVKTAPPRLPTRMRFGDPDELRVALFRVVGLRVHPAAPFSSGFSVAASEVAADVSCGDG